MGFIRGLSVLIGAFALLSAAEIGLYQFVLAAHSNDLPFALTAFGLFITNVLTAVNLAVPIHD